MEQPVPEELRPDIRVARAAAHDQGDEHKAPGEEGSPGAETIEHGRGHRAGLAEVDAYEADGAGAGVALTSAAPTAPDCTPHVVRILV